MVSVRVMFTLRIRVRERLRLKFTVRVSVMFAPWFKISISSRVIASFQFCER